MNKPLILVFIIFFILIAGYWTITGFVVANNTISDEFVSCLVENGAVMYGTDWCSHCAEQKKLFGKNWKKFEDLTGYIECTENSKLCESNEINDYPTWIINGQVYKGVLSLEKLSEITGCEIN